MHDMRSYEIYLTADDEFQLLYKTGEANGDYPSSWSTVGLYPDVEAAKRAAEAHDKRLKKVEYVRTVPPIKFDLI
jgi:hypothetical protein